VPKADLSYDIDADPQPSHIFDAETLRIVAVNAAALRLLGYSRHEYLSRTIVGLRPESDQPRVRAELEQLRDAASSRTMERQADHWRYLRRDGTALEIAVDCRQLEYHGRPAYLSRFNVAAPSAAAANTDPLTTLPNRAAFMQSIDQHLEQLAHETDPKAGFAVLLVAIDRLDQFNVSFGRPYGDAILVATAARLGAALSESTRLYRIEGGTFAALLPGVVEMRSARSIARRIVSRNITAARKLDADEIFATTTVGISVAPQDGRDAETLYRAASLAVHSVESHRRERLAFFTPSLAQHAKHMLRTESALRRATAEHRFTVSYQPIIEVHTARIAACEALLRWNKGTFEDATVTEVITIAERVGLIGELGQFVMREACAQGRRWEFAGLRSVRMAINVSAQELEEPAFLRSITDICRATGFDPQCLDLELTERAISGTDLARRNLEAVQRLGARISLDDFGTGYSSLSSLGDQPINIVKIDRMLTARLSAPKSTAIVRAIIDLAHALDLRVVAEGVETAAQYDLLASIECDYMQGFYFSPAVDGDAFAKMLAAEPPPQAARQLLTNGSA